MPILTFDEDINELSMNLYDLWLPALLTLRPTGNSL